MHRCYQPILPAHNKLLQKRWDSTYYDEHRRKIQEARPIVDTRPPQTYMHLHLKLKKLQLEEERLSTVERDNRILLEKMSYVMRTRGRVDNKNNYEYKSLNREKRMRELLRVTQENQDILRRITVRKPQYDHQKWQRDWEENQRFMDSIAQYPRDWWKKDEQPQRKREKSTMSDNGSQRSSRREKSTMSDSGSQKSDRKEKKSKEEKRDRKERRDSDASDNEDEKKKKNKKEKKGKGRKDSDASDSEDEKEKKNKHEKRGKDYDDNRNDSPHDNNGQSKKESKKDSPRKDVDKD